MKAAILFEAQKPVTVDTVDIGEPGPGEVLRRAIGTTCPYPQSLGTKAQGS